MWYTQMASPVGRLWLAADDAGLRHVHFPNNPLKPESHWVADEGPLRDVAQQLDEYFAGDRQTFSLDLAPTGTTFQRQIWTALSKVAHGRTFSYGQLAARAGRRGAARAVGSAVGANPISIVIPCHRIMGADGSLTGFGGGLNRKRTLLRLEGIEV
jgi:methylated-DNA-[protein]-cysteine S-methyltransferase